MLEAHLQVRVGSFDLDVELTVDDGEVVALIGPNGAGKTTALRAIAGLRPLDDGFVAVDGTVLERPSTATFVPTGQRPVGVVFQDHLLFPRLSALDNVAFGLRAGGARRAAARLEAAGWLERFGLADHAGSRPAALSGGQAQRVALARVLAIRPRLLLLDEPLSALDASTRLAVRSDLRRLLATFDGARLLVTHDPVDAAVLADRVVVVEEGRVVQTGTPVAVAARPASRYVAELMGVNLLLGQATGAHTVLLDAGAELTVADPLPPGRVAVAVRPQAVALHGHRPDGSPRNTWRATVADLEVDRGRVRVRLDGPVPATAEVTPAAVAELGLAPGGEVWAAVKAVDLVAYER